jgi:hypothetical protein
MAAVSFLSSILLSSFSDAVSTHSPFILYSHQKIVECEFRPYAHISYPNAVYNTLSLSQSDKAAPSNDHFVYSRQHITLYNGVIEHIIKTAGIAEVVFNQHRIFLTPRLCTLPTDDTDPLLNT